MSTMVIGQIALTDSEKTLLEQIALAPQFGVQEYEAAVRNGSLACALMHSLIARDAIPEPRARYFSDPDYKAGKVKGSRRDMFERNGNHGDEVYRHPNFIKYLLYFINGADLPAQLIKTFRSEIESLDGPSSSDLEPLRKMSRQLVRQHRLQPYEASGEFYKLALDCGLSLHFSDSIRRTIREMRYGT